MRRGGEKENGWGSIWKCNFIISAKTKLSLQLLNMHSAHSGKKEEKVKKQKKTLTSQT